MRSASLMPRTALLAGAALALPTLFACLDHPLKPVELQKEQEKQEGIALSVNKDVDILFVIDNSGSMGEEQANVSANFANFIEVLEQDGVEANYRIGVTTTDNGNPVCSGTTPEGGSMRTIPCVDRLSEFVFEGADTIDAQTACTDFCPSDMTGLATTNGKPWMQSIEGETNLPGDVTPTQAFQCFGPQGINGCGFESHLESMYKALRRSEEPDETQQGFLREGAILSIIFVTDELDCSHNNDYGSIFQRDGMRTFWSDPSANQATSAVCWNAGVECTGSSPYSECNAVNKDVSGSVGVPASDAVLRPVTRYTNLVQAFEDQKKNLNPNQEVLVAVIAGVPQGYAQEQAEITYADTQDASFQNSFGIGPGCTSNVAEAVPPVRLREFAEAFEIDGERNLYSVCAESYAPALNAIAETIAEQVKPACMPECVADTDLSTEVLDPTCQLQQDIPGGESMPLEECVYLCGGSPCARTEADDWDYPQGADVCYRMLTDANGSTPSPIDDMDMACTEAGNNLEFKIERRAPAPGGTSVKATCTLSETQSIDCPLQ